MNEITAILPARGRVDETLDLIPRLVSVAGMPFDLVVVVDADRQLYDALEAQTPLLRDRYYNKARVGYWTSLKWGIAHCNTPYVVNLANDLLPGRSWLLRAYNALRETFGEGEGLVGFNDGIHVGEHASHFLISRSLLRRWYGEDYVPLSYGHSFGDTEISQRAITEKLFVVAHFAVLFHNHYFTGRPNDAVYDEGRETAREDEATFHRRQANNWRR